MESGKHEVCRKTIRSNAREPGTKDKRATESLNSVGILDDFSFLAITRKKSVPKD